MLLRSWAPMGTCRNTCTARNNYCNTITKTRGSQTFEQPSAWRHRLLCGLDPENPGCKTGIGVTNLRADPPPEYVKTVGLGLRRYQNGVRDVEIVARAADDERPARRTIAGPSYERSIGRRAPAAVLTAYLFQHAAGGRVTVRRGRTCDSTPRGDKSQHPAERHVKARSGETCESTPRADM